MAEEQQMKKDFEPKFKELITALPTKLSDARMM
jgi:hypothetical protein